MFDAINGRSDFCARSCAILFFFILGLSADATAGSLPAFDRVMELDPPRDIQNFSLIDQDGDTFNIGDLRGKVVLVFFGFTNCPDVCPTTMTRLRQLYTSGLVSTNLVKVLLVSVDGERDTPPVMKAFLQRFSPDFIGLTGDSINVKRIVKEFRASSFKGSVGPDNDYTVSHSTQVFLLDQDGRLRAEFHSATIEAMAEVTNVLLAGQN